MNKPNEACTDQVEPVRLTGFDLVEERYDADSFANAHATSPRMVFLRDCGIEFLDVARSGPPRQSLSMGELKIAMG